ncbi:MAG: 4Fe-4S dicluster domain-containing protein [Phycisphaerae bacterium]
MMSETSKNAGDRRSFFRAAAAKMLGPVSDFIEERTAPEYRPIYLRPPGAIDEAAFLQTCRQGGACVQACPANAIFSLAEQSGVARGTPVIDPDAAACVVCTDLACTHACPSGALLPIDRPRDIRMGVAEVYAPLCLRQKNEACTICVEQCPLGESAILFTDDGPPHVLAEGCVGCGVCQFYCPTSPKAITVRPKTEVAM